MKSVLANLRKLLSSPILPPVLLVLFTTLFFARTIFDFSRAYVGDVCSIDFQGTIQQLWLLHFHGFDLDALSSTTYMTYPIPVNLLSELGFLLDIGLLAVLQALAGAVAGYNLGVWILLVGLALSVWHCARRFGLAPWFAALAGALMVSAEPALIEVSFGRHYQILSLALATLAFAEWPQLSAGNRYAAIRMGVLGTLTLLAHAFTGLIAGLIVLFAALVSLWTGNDAERLRLLKQLAWATGAAMLSAIGPVWLQMHNLPTGEEGIAMLSGYSAYYQRILGMPELEGTSPLGMLQYGRLRLVPLALGLLALFMARPRHLRLFFGVTLALALVVVWGPYETFHLNLPDLIEPRAVSIPLPYLALRAVVPYFWRMLWLSRAALFANLALALLSASALAWTARALHQRRALAAGVVAAVLGICVVQPYLAGRLPLPSTPVLSRMPADGREAAKLLRRIKGNPDVQVLYSFPRSLHLQRYYQRPLSARKWSFEVFCGERSLEQSARHFASFVDIAPGGAPASEIEAGLCFLAEQGTTHLLYVPRTLIRTSTFRVDPEADYEGNVEEDVLTQTFDGLATRVDAGGGMVLYRLKRCDNAPQARASRPTVTRPPEPKRH